MTVDKKPNDDKYKTKEEIEAAVDKRIDDAVDGIMKLMARALAEKHVAEALKERENTHSLNTSNGRE